MSRDEEFLLTLGIGCLLAALGFAGLNWLTLRRRWGREDYFGYLAACVFLMLAALCSIPWWPGVDS